MPLKNKLTRNIFYCYLPIVVLFAVIRMLSHFGLLDFLGKTGTIIINIVVQIGLLFSISIFLFSFLQKSSLKETFKFYGFRKISIKSIFLSILIGVIVYILNIFVATFFNAILSMFGYNFSGSSTTGAQPIWLLFVNLLITAVLPAICEETAHRGMLLKGLSPLGRKWAIIISSILFGLMHMNIEQFFYATIIGLFLGYLSTICETIYPAMIIHFMNNAISVIMSFSRTNNWGIENAVNWIWNGFSGSPVLSFIFMFLFIFLLLFVLRYLVGLLFKDTAFKKINELQNVLFREIARENYLKELDEISKGNLEQPSNSISFEEFDKLYKNKSLDMGHISNLDNHVIFNEEKYKMDSVTKALMITCFILAGAITLFTFIWNLLIFLV